MEDILLKRLSVFATEIKSLSEKSLNLCTATNEDASDAIKINASKLQSKINRFNTDLYQYFNISTNPNPDEISNLTTIQLEGEETLAELNARIKIKDDLKTKTSTTIGSTFTTKLPEMNLPLFEGDVLEWHQFWDQFSSNIDQRNLRDVDKLLYLKASLRGEAKTTIDGLDTTNANYKIAISSLQNRYGKKSHVIDAHYSKLYKIKRAEAQEECRKTLNEIERHLRVLESLGEDTNHNHLRFLIMEKFPEDIVYEMKLKISTDSIAEIRKQLSLIVTAREDAARMMKETQPSRTDSYTTETLHVTHAPRNRNNTENSRNFKKSNPAGHKSQKTTSFYTQSNLPIKRTHSAGTDFKNKRIKIKMSCIFCNEDGTHYPENCNKVKTLGERKGKLRNRCFICFRAGHRSSQCKAKRACFHCGKQGHNRALCLKILSKRTEQVQTMYTSTKGTTVLQTAVVLVKGQKGKSKTCRILLDSGSQRSYVTSETAKDLQLKTEEENHLLVFTFGAKVPQEIDSPLVKLTIETKTNKNKTLFANIVPSITPGIPCPEPSGGKYADKYVLADDGSLADRVDILIGNDYYHSFTLKEKIQIKEDLYLVESELGWILSGQTEKRNTDDLSVVTYFQSTCETKLHRPDPPLDNGNIKFLWDLESIGITDSPKINRDEEAIKHFNENTIMKDNRYHVSWPWNNYPPDLQSNFGLAYGRLVNLLKRLDSNALSAYNQTLQEQLENGIIEVVSSEDKVEHPVQYLPHLGVYAPGKSTRIVYDASASTKGSKSLNECLYCGPMMLEDLTGLLIKFRCHAVGISADVEKAFLQIGLLEPDRDVTRFLWLKDTSKPATKDNLLCFRFTRVPFGIISSPFLLNATIKHHLLKSKSKSVKKLATDIYVDNVLTGTNTTQQAIKLYEESKEAFQQISMNLRSWSSNSSEFMRYVPDTCPDKVVKTLGLKWDLDKDTLGLRACTMTNTCTKRGILKEIAAIYDPCGFAVPIVLPAKLLLQDLWKLKIKWDASLPKEINDKWKLIQEDLKETNEICLPRCIKVSKDKNCQLHCFTDSSTKAYSAVVYLVQEQKKSFVIGKSRLVPIKDQDHLKIPRLELLGVLIGSRLIKYVRDLLEENVTQQTLWTDSQIVIDWYNSNKLLAPFVSRRIEEIKKNCSLTVRYVPSNQNPADVATRPTCSKEERKRWLSGPDFLTLEPSEWPTGPIRAFTLLEGEGLPNVKVSHKEPSRDTGIKVDSNEMQQDLQEEEVQTNRNLKRSNQCQTDSTIQEVKQLQIEHFTEEYNGKETNLSRNLKLFKDIDGLLRCKGRLKYAAWSFDKRYPVLIPKHSEFTNQIIKNTHEKNYHVGVNHTLSIIRQSYWIPQGKSIVQKILRKCPRCVKHGGGPFQLPPTPALPPERVNYSMPFSFTGVDYLGPVSIKTKNGPEKRWICLFTCLAVRAVHLEVVQDLTAEEGLLALRRMISTRGVPTLITSDNALHFKLLADILAKPHCVDNKIKWRFIPELAPWHGGFYERLVSLVKHCMKRTLQKHLLGASQLSTIVKEIEAIINTRPLTCVDSELDHILKPSDFLSIGKCITMDTSNEKVLVQGTTTKIDLIKGWKRAQIILEEFKEMFINRYLVSLRERYSHSHKEPRVKSKEIPQEGQVVQIKGDKNREGWKVGKIISLIKGKDGLCRVAKVKVGNAVFTRSISHLYPLEVEENETCYENNRKSTPEEPVIADQEMNYSHKDCMQIDLTNNSTEGNANEIKESTDMVENTDTDSLKEAIDLNSTSEDTVMMDNNEAEMESVSDSRDNIATQQQANPKRAAAVRALEKIREWTRDLTTTLL